MSMLGDFSALFKSQPTSRTAAPTLDAKLLLVGIALVGFGLLMVYSASIALADGPRYANYGRYYFVIRHTAFVTIGLVGALFVASVPMQVWRKLALPIFIISLLLLLVVLIPGIGRTVNGARRWLPLGPINFQPSELMKVAMILFVAYYIERKQAYMGTFLRGLAPIVLSLGVVAGLIIMEPDLGAVIVIVAIAIGLLFIGGMNKKYIAGLIVLMCALFLMMIWVSPWRVQRFLVYLDPWNPDNAYGSAYQLSHSLIALGRGEWFGVGIGSSVEKLHYLPEAHTDFIVAVIGEELGFFGVALLILAFVFVVHRAFQIAHQAIANERLFSALVAHGVGIWFAIQTFINIGVCFGLLPTKGLTLPLVSYGGTGVVMNLAAFAMLLRVDFENRSMMVGRRV